MPSKKDLDLFVQAAEARLLSLEEDRAATNAHVRLHHMDGRLASLEETGVREARRAVGEREVFAEMQERLASLETSGDAVKYMWESMPTMMAEIRQKHESLFSSISDMRGILSAVKTVQETEERDAKLDIERERNDALTVLREYLTTTEDELKGVRACFDEAMKTLKPVPPYAVVCRWCCFRWWEHGYKQGQQDPRYSGYGRGMRGTRTKDRCVKCDEVWEAIRYN